MPALRRLALVSLVIAVGALLSACSTTVSLDPAPHANDPLCAEVTVRLPDSVQGADRVWTDAQATGAWGLPKPIVLRCGIEPPGPSTLPCHTYSGVDWLALEQEEDRQQLITYGRDPAVQLIIPRGEDFDFASVAETISRFIEPGLSPRTGRCE